MGRLCSVWFVLFFCLRHLIDFPPPAPIFPHKPRLGAPRLASPSASVQAAASSGLAIIAPIITQQGSQPDTLQVAGGGGGAPLAAGEWEAAAEPSQGVAPAPPCQEAALPFESSRKEGGSREGRRRLVARWIRPRRRRRAALCEPGEAKERRAWRGRAQRPRGS